MSSGSLGMKFLIRSTTSGLFAQVRIDHTSAFISELLVEICVPMSQVARHDVENHGIVSGVFAVS